MPTFKVKNKSEVAKLVRFSTGKLNPDAKDNIEFQSFRVKDEVKCEKRKMVVTTEVQGIKYSGQNYGLSNHFSTDTCDYYVAIHREGKEKVRVLPAELFLMQPQFEDTQGPESEDQASKTYRVKRFDLIKQFGSGQLQRKVNKLIKSTYEEGMMASTTESVANNFIKNKQISDQTQSLDGDGGAKLNECSIVPPHNKDATTPEDVYLLETIIPSWVMDALTEQSQEFVSCTQEKIAEWRENNEYSEIVLSLLEKLPSDENERRQRCPNIMFLHCLIYNYSLKAVQIRAKSTTYPESWKGLVKKVMDENFIAEVVEFNKKKRRCRPSQLKDLILSHILILYMRICNYYIALNPLVTDLKLPLKRIALHAQMLGFKVKAEKTDQCGNITTATLQVPLKFPQPKKIPEKRRRR